MERMNPTSDFYVFTQMLDRAGTRYMTSKDMADPYLTILSIENLKSRDEEDPIMADVLFIFSSTSGNLLNVGLRKEKPRG